VLQLSRQRLEEHYEDAHDAFSRIFKLDEYAEARA
jgi:hypothetical protein